MEMNADSAHGKLIDTFVTKESENREAVEKLGADFKEIIAEVKLKLEFARKAEIFMADGVSLTQILEILMQLAQYI